MGREHQAPVAYGAAQAYLKSIEPAYDLFERNVRSRNSGGADPIAANPGEIAPVVSGIAFAMELFLKVLQIQERGSAARGHDVFDLWQHLSQDTRDRIEARYSASVRRWTEREGLPFVLINTTGAPVPFEPEPSATCANALQRIGKSFERWRYMYEIMKDGGSSLYFNFAEAFGAVDAVREEILNFPGNVVVEMNVAGGGVGP